MKHYNDWNRFHSTMDGIYSFMPVILSVLSAVIFLLVVSTIGYGQDNSSSSSNEPQSGYLKIVGKITNTANANADYYLYELDCETCEWEKVCERENVSRFNLTLDPTKEYQIWFLDGESIKILHVDAGYSGLYRYQIDVNFDSNASCRITPIKDPIQVAHDVHIIGFGEAKALLTFN